jgi:hypothetical protein
VTDEVKGGIWGGEDYLNAIPRQATIEVHWLQRLYPGSARFINAKRLPNSLQGVKIWGTVEDTRGGFDISSIAPLASIRN